MVEVISKDLNLVDPPEVSYAEYTQLGQLWVYIPGWGILPLDMALPLIPTFCLAP